MKKQVIILAFIFFIGMASASYKCADDTKLTEDIGRLALGERDHIGGINIGLSFTRDISATGLMEAEIFIDSKKISLTDGNITIVQFSDNTEYNVSLLNVSEFSASIKIGSNSNQINVLDTATIEGILVFLISSVGDYPGSPNVDLLVGKSKIFLSSENNPDEIINFNDQEHLIELYSATDSEAVITIKKCSNRSTEIIQIADQNNSNNNNTLNQTKITITNNTIRNGTNQTNGDNYTSNQTNNSEDNSDVFQDEQKKRSNIVWYISIGGMIFFVIIVLILGAKYIKNKSNETTKKQKSLGIKDGGK